MPIQIDCTGCGQVLQAPDDAVGKRIRCPKCEATIEVASAGAAQPVAEFTSPPPRSRGVKPDRPSSDSQGASRYRNAADDIQADCVIHVFNCDSDDDFGRELAIAVRDILRADGTFERVVVTEDPDITGSAVTVEDGIASLVAIPGGMLKKAVCSLAASAELHNTDGEQESVSATAEQPSGSMKQMLKANKKVVSTAIARGALRHGSSNRRLRQEISGMAIASMIFGMLALIPFAGFVLAVLWLITAIIVLVYNGGRSPKIGLIRVGIGFAFALIGLLISVWMMSAGSRGRRGPYGFQPQHERTVHQSVEHVSRTAAWER